MFLVGHNWRALSTKVLGRKSPIFDIEHLQLFSRESVGASSSAAGFADIEILPVLNRYPLTYWARLFPFPAGLKNAVLAALRSSFMGRCVIPLPAGNLAAIAYK